MTADPFPTRVEQAREYLALVACPPWKQWASGYELFLDGNLPVTSALFLAHPSWLVNPGRQEQVQGKRSFDRTRTSGVTRCRADVYWGYECTLGEDVQFDHVFPYAFGGPTSSDNRLPLCAVHNACKGHDVHLYPWPDTAPAWLSDQLRRMSCWT